MIVALFRCLVLPHYLRPFSSPSLPPLLLSSSVQEKREKGGKKDEEYTEKKKNVERRKRSYATMLAHCLPQRNPLNRGRSLRSLHIGKKSELMGVLVAWHRQEHRRIEGQAAGWKKDNRKKEEEEKEEDRPVADRTIDLWWPYIPSKGERKRERMSVSRAVKRRTLAGHVRLTPLPKRPLPTARLRVGILLTERSQTYDPVYFRSYTCCRCVAVAGYR